MTVHAGNGADALDRGAPADQLAADEALLEQLRPGTAPWVRWYVVDRPALVLGFAQRLRRADLVDAERCRAAGVQVLERRAGGGVVLLDGTVLCLTVALPAGHPFLLDDLTESYRWLGEALVAGLRAAGVESARRVAVAAARADSAALAARATLDPTTALLRAACFGGLAPHEVVAEGAKLAGLAQVRRRQGALFQVGVLLRNQAPLADLLRVADSAQRERFRRALASHTVGVAELLAHAPRASELAGILAPWITNSLRDVAEPSAGSEKIGPRPGSTAPAGQEA